MEGRPVIQVENIAKRYRLGNYGTASLADEVQALWSRLRGKEGPLGTVDTSSQGQRTGRIFWALREVGFEMREGEVLGIIGRNGAGKSTLLKLLSRITKPTSGVIRMKGRTASLLEVGTGFHPDLTGRENIFLNGAILGMRKAEITTKLDEIIAFSGIEHHIDTPVKRYSSGMKVRLGFAVAAHLEPEILIVDEVLAVGDAEFQRKCLGKMKDVSRSGRTILFVSHNMVAVQSLCPRSIWLHEGRVRMDGPSSSVVQGYLKGFAVQRDAIRWTGAERPGNELVRLMGMDIRPAMDVPLITTGDAFHITIDLENLGVDDNDLNIGIDLYNADDIQVFTSTIRDIHGPDGWAPAEGVNTVRCHIPAPLLNTGMHRISVNVFRSGKVIFRAEDAIAFEVHDAPRKGTWFGQRPGIISPLLAWSTRP
ncbi:MAG: ABC transporter ATP-binding protein [Bacteroidetes bacterium]|nr:ABC transporter ATP-binding protein [Bacteroidota bacterium]